MTTRAAKFDEIQVILRLQTAESQFKCVGSLIGNPYLRFGKEITSDNFIVGSSGCHFFCAQQIMKPQLTVLERITSEREDLNVDELGHKRETMRASQRTYS